MGTARVAKRGFSLYLQLIILFINQLDKQFEPHWPRWLMRFTIKAIYLRSDGLKFFRRTSYHNGKDMRLWGKFTQNNGKFTRML